MRLLICTQAVDLDDPVLSFFHGWLVEFSKRFEHIHVICLKEGRHDLPKNVTVHSLGKETGPSRFKYTFRFYRYIWSLRKEYNAVFVHMNQEYVLLGGAFWRLWGKHIYLWRNHYAGSISTGLAAAFCSNVFYTSKHSFTARYRNALQMPVGINTNIFKSNTTATRMPHSILFLARMSPSKRPDILVDALGQLRARGTSFSAALYGDAALGDEGYLAEVKKRAHDLGLSEVVTFHAGVPNQETPSVYAAHDISVNLSRSGMYDKTIFEAAACGCIVIASSLDFRKEVGDRFCFNEHDVSELADRIGTFLVSAPKQRAADVQTLQDFARNNSLEVLALRLREVIA